MNRSHVAGVIGCCVTLAACGSTGAPSGTVTVGANSSQSGSSHALQFALCMRSHGVSNFPDPTSGGGINLDGTGVNPKSPAFQSARQKCKALLPGGVNHIAAPTAAQKRAALAFAQCMRAHGESDFPDPTTRLSPTTPDLSIQGLLFPVGPSLDPNSPAFKDAASACGIKPPPS
jgi:hypothetical protein